MSTPLNAINDVQVILGYEFQNPQLLLEALKTAGSGFNSRQGPAGLDGNKRVAKVGSAILKLAILDDWYHSGATREIANQLVSRISSVSYLCECGRRAGLEPHIITNFSHKDEPPTPGVIALSVEALFGAIWYDSQGDLQSVRQVIQRLDPSWTPNR